MTFALVFYALKTVSLSKLFPLLMDLAEIHFQVIVLNFIMKKLMQQFGRKIIQPLQERICTIVLKNAWNKFRIFF